MHEGRMKGPVMTQSQEGRDNSSEDPNSLGPGRKEKLRASRKVSSMAFFFWSINAVLQLIGPIFFLLTVKNTWTR